MSVFLAIMCCNSWRGQCVYQGNKSSYSAVSALLLAVCFTNRHWEKTQTQPINTDDHWIYSEEIAHSLRTLSSSSSFQFSKFIMAHWPLSHFQMFTEKQWTHQSPVLFLLSIRLPGPCKSVRLIHFSRQEEGTYQLNRWFSHLLLCCGLFWYYALVCLAFQFLLCVSPTPFVTSPVLFPPHWPHLFRIPSLVCLGSPYSLQQFCHPSASVRLFVMFCSVPSSSLLLCLPH